VTVKIFISHSQEEDWLVAMIAAELKTLSVETYHMGLNSTGTEIMSTTTSELHTADEVLVLLTPSSVKSPWVIGELAIAHSLNTKIIAFYMYVDLQALPPWGASALRRHMRDLHLYYDEVRKRVAPGFVDEKVRVHEEQAKSDAPGAEALASSGVTQAVENPEEAKRIFHRVLASPPVAIASPPQPAPRRKRTRKTNTNEAS
jgi:TIR domain